MPNHCSNKLIVIGSYVERSNFVKNVKSGDDDLCFNKILPMPDNIDRNDTVTGMESIVTMFSDNGWRGWRNKNWGTKWDAYRVYLTHDEKKTEYVFKTAYNPPNKVLLNKYRSLFPSVRLELLYAECGFNIYGYWSSDDPDNLTCHDVTNEVEWDEDNEDFNLLDKNFQPYFDLYRTSG